MWVETIDGRRVCLTDKVWRGFLNEYATRENLDALEIIAMHAFGTEHHFSAAAYTIELLRNELRRDPEKFIREREHFDIVGFEAQHEVDHLLCLHCFFFEFGQWYDCNDGSAVQKTQLPPHWWKILSDWKGLRPRTYPDIPRSNFALVNSVRPPKWWWKYTKKLPEKTVIVRVDSRKVQRIYGELADFTVVTDHFQLECRPESIDVRPPVEGSAKGKVDELNY